MEKQNMMEQPSWRIIWLCIAWAGAGILFAGSGVGGAETFTVDDNGAGDFYSIQDAINASEDGDTIRVFEGAYYENVIVNRSISLVGNGSSNTSIIGTGHIIWIREKNVEVSGFNIIGDGEMKYYRACIIIDGSYGGRKGQIHDNLLSNNKMGIIIESSRGNSLINNSCYDNKFGIYLGRAKDSNITGNSCYGNTYGIYVYDNDGENSISGNSLYDNEHDLFSEQDEHQKDANNKFFMIVGSSIVIAILFAIMVFPPWKSPN